MYGLPHKDILASKGLKVHLEKFDYVSINGNTVSLSAYKGKKILIVNTASQCGYTPQYEDLEKLYKQYQDKLVIIGFPANNYGGQEPGTNSDINNFCKKNYGVTFPMAAKVSVKGNDMAPIFKWLTSQTNPDFTGDINWNFEILDGSPASVSANSADRKSVV